MAVKESVGLVVLVGSDVRSDMRAVLQVRGVWNPEKGKLESYAGGCQVTVHGKVEEGENKFEALVREAREELGSDFALVLKSIIVNAGSLPIVAESIEKGVVTYAVRLPLEILDAIRLNPFSGVRLRLISRKEVEKIVDLEPSFKEGGVPDLETIAMFPDEKEAVANTFPRLG